MSDPINTRENIIYSLPTLDTQTGELDDQSLSLSHILSLSLYLLSTDSFMLLQVTQVALLLLSLETAKSRQPDGGALGLARRSVAGEIRTV